MKLKLILIVALAISSLAVELNHKFINSEYIALTEKQKDNIMYGYNIGKSLKIYNEEYGYTGGTFVAIESSYGIKLVGDGGTTFGLTHFSLDRARELLVIDPLYNHYTNYPDERLKDILKKDNQLNMHLCMLNFKLNLIKFNYNYSKAIRKHNGYSPERQIYNRRYYNHFINLMQVVKLVVKERNGNI